MKLRVHADDLGVSRGVTDEILRCIDEGPVAGASIIDPPAVEARLA